MSIRNVLFATGTIGQKGELKFLQKSVMELITGLSRLVTLSV